MLEFKNITTGFLVGYRKIGCDFQNRSLLLDTHRNVSPRCLLMPGSDWTGYTDLYYYYDPVTNQCQERQVNTISICKGFSNLSECQTTCTPTPEFQEFSRADFNHVATFQRLHTCTVPEEYNNCKIVRKSRGYQCRCSNPTLSSNDIKKYRYLTTTIHDIDS